MLGGLVSNFDFVESILKKEGIYGFPFEVVIGKSVSTLVNVEMMPLKISLINDVLCSTGQSSEQTIMGVITITLIPQDFINPDAIKVTGITRVL